MPDRSMGLALCVSLVLLLTFKDLALVKTSVEQQKHSDSKQHEPINLSSSNEDDNDDDDEFSNRAHGEALNENLKTDQEEHDEHLKKIPSLKMRTNVQTVRFSFCYSCGYRNAFEQFSHAIKQRYPELKIVGENYAPQQYKVYIAQFLSMFKMALIGLLLFGANPFAYLNWPTPNIWTWAQENKLYACLMTFFISNAIETQMITTGAFEVYLNDIQIWSKLQSDRFPHEKELLQILDLNFNFEPEKAASSPFNAKF